MTNIPEAESYGQLDRDFDNEIYATFNLPEAEDKETEKEDLNARLNELERRNKDLEARQKTIPTTFEQTYTPPVQPNPSNIPPQDIEKQLEQAFIANPGATLKNILIAAQQNAEQNIRSKYIPLAASSIRNQVSMFRQQANLDPEVEEEFDNIIKSIPNEQLASVNPAEVPNYLKQFAAMAKGNAIEKGWIPQTARNIPPLTGGGRGGSLRPNQKRVKLTPAQQDMKNVIDNDPTYSAWSDKEKYEAIMEAE